MGWQDAPVVNDAPPAAKPRWMSAPVEQARAAPAPLASQAAPSAQGPLLRALQFANDNIADPIFGAAETALTMGTGAVGDIAGRAAGLASIPIDLAGVAMGRNPGETADPSAVRDAVSGAITWKPRTQSAQALMRTVAAPFERFEQSKDQLQDIVTDATGSTLAGDLAKAGANASQGVLEFLPGVKAARAAGVLHQPIRRVPESMRAEVDARRDSRIPPTKDELGAAAKAAYQRAEQAGVVLNPESVTGLKARASATAEGIDPTLHPQATAALRRIAESDGQMTLEQLETLRRITKDAQAGAAMNPADRRMAAMLEDVIDEHFSGLKQADLVSGDAPAAVQALEDARNLYSRSRKSQAVDEMLERAELRGKAQFTASGVENAIRVEFRQLALNPRRMRLFAPEEQAGIRAVAEGGPIENTLRQLGKLAPTGIVSAGGSIGLGALAAGTPGAIALPAVGFASRMGATRMQTSNVHRLSELMRRGPAGSAPLSRPEAVAPLQQRLSLASDAGPIPGLGDAFAGAQIPQVPPTLGLVPDRGPGPVLSGTVARPTPAEVPPLADILAGDLSLESPPRTPLMLPAPGQVAIPMSNDVLAARTLADELGLTDDVRFAGARHPASSSRNAVLSPRGTREYGQIGDDIAIASGGRFPAGPIRLEEGVAGRDGYGASHIAPDRIRKFKAAGYENELEALADVSENYTHVYEQPNGRLLLVKDDARKGYAAVELRPDGNYYSTTTWFLNDRSPGKRQYEIGKKGEENTLLLRVPRATNPGQSVQFPAPGDAIRAGGSRQSGQSSGANPTTPLGQLLSGSQQPAGLPPGAPLGEHITLQGPRVRRQPASIEQILVPPRRPR